MARTKSASEPVSPVRPVSVGFLLSQVGFHVAGCFAERIAPLGLKPYHAGILSILGSNPGLTQQGLADLLGVFPSRLVALLDELGKEKLVERRPCPADRRTYALHLTKAGRDASAKVGKLASAMEDDVCASLNAKEREALCGLLTRIVAQQQITPGVHPGFRKLSTPC